MGRAVAAAAEGGRREGKGDGERRCSANVTTGVGNPSGEATEYARGFTSKPNSVQLRPDQLLPAWALPIVHVVLPSRYCHTHRGPGEEAQATGEDQVLRGMGPSSLLRYQGLRRWRSKSPKLQTPYLVEEACPRMTGLLVGDFDARTGGSRAG